jgi:hypothetical protein
MTTIAFLDIDGTLIGSSGGVSEPVWRAAEQVRRAGGRLAICTGRPFGGVAGAIAERLDPDAPHIVMNGALVRTTTEILFTRGLDAATIAPMIEASRRWGATLELYTPERHYVDEITPECARHAEILEIEPTAEDLEAVAEREEIMKTHWIIPHAMVDRALGLDLPACEAEVANSPTMPDVSFISVTRRGVDKGMAARQAVRRLDTSLQQAWGVGDSESDRPMLEAVGHPFVMANGIEQLRGTYPTVGEVDADGVLEVFERMRRTLDRSADS